MRQQKKRIRQIAKQRLDTALINLSDPLARAKMRAMADSPLSQWSMAELKAYREHLAGAPYTPDPEYDAKLQKYLEGLDIEQLVRLRERLERGGSMPKL